MRLNLQFHSVRRKNSLGALILFLLLSETFCARPEFQSCISQDCKEITESIAASINRAVQPCDDFYEHACGFWSKIHPAPYDKDSWDSPDIITDKVWYQLKDLLNGVNDKHADVLEKKAKKAYDVCNNMAEIERHGIEFLLFVTDDMGGWPMITPQRERAETVYSWKTAHVSYGGLIGEGALISINVEEDSFNNAKPTLYLDQPTGLFKGSSIMNTEEDEIKYGLFVKSVVKAFSMARNQEIPDERTLHKDIDKLLKFRKHLKLIMTWGPDRHDLQRMHNPTTIKHLQDWNDEFNKETKNVIIHWKSFIQDTIEYSSNVHITDEETIIIHELDYIEDLLTLLAKTDNEVIVNHIHLYFVEKYMKYADSKMRKLVSDIRMESGNFDGESRWKTCISTHPMKHVLSRMYVTKYFSDATKKDITELVSNLQKTAIEKIERSPWLSKNVKENAVKKIRSIELILGYPDWYQNPKLMADYYKDQDVLDVYICNVLSYERMAYRREIETLSPENFRNTMWIYPMEVDIGYMVTKNKLEIAAATLQLPFFSADVPDVILYSTTGHIVAHELAHAFDRQGRMYNEHGIKEDWWDEQSLAYYNERIKCIIDKYSNLPIKGLQEIDPHLRSNGMVTVNEDFSDILGLDVAFKSYKKRRQGKKDVSSNIAALKEFNDDKIFFYANAQLYCEYIDSDALIELIEDEDHSTNSLRVNGAFSNMPEFSATFGCPIGSFMNPRTKCHIWDK